ncbi:MAG TPA: DNA topoisomerase (ATP-hydrolyzing) subunit B [Candidatus Paceibacterota bacterium]|nr:DNA topoisomerase (ATP-hydrolyzing) subunit B [Candidatus Paceibacterota bacterium]
MAPKESKKASYSASDIYVLEGLEPVRKRPGMYIGSTGIDGLHHLIWEVFDNSLDEAMAGHANLITVTLLPDNRVSVEDNGRGIPVEKHKQTGVSALETVMTTLHAGGKFGGEAYKVAGGLHGVGVSVVNALSSWLKAEVHRDGAVYEQEYVRGKPKKAVRKTGTSRKVGTVITFEPDSEIFNEREFRMETILSHLRQQAYLTKGVRIDIVDRRNPVQPKDRKEPQFPTYSFFFEGGIVSYVEYLAHGLDAKHKNAFYVAKQHENMFVEIALRYVDDLNTKEVGFANNIHTTEGGMHMTGFKTALTRVLNDYARKNSFLKEKDDNLSGEDVREGLIAIVSIKIASSVLQFEGQTKAKLGNPEARTGVESVMAAEFADWLDRNPNDARSILEQVILASKARLAAKAARETVLRKGALDGLTLPGKLADCSSRDASESEIFIVEGDSAGGSSKAGRDRRTQAILPLRGKILNVERARIDKMLASQEVRSLIIALGTAIADEFDISKLRYHKVVIMTDADVDGAHIRTLLLTLFYRYFPQLIDGGHIYVAQPPLYRVAKGSAVRYAYSDQERDALVAEFAGTAKEKGGAKKTSKAKKAAEGFEETPLDGQQEPELAVEGEDAAKVSGVSIQRYKGLGEMNPDQLWETTMNPENRMLYQVTVKDAEEANRTFDVLMGSDVMPRKKFIQTHAQSVQNLDI